jgi:3-(3-hydroxy-phenyl)propionate hydroxylase
VTDRAFDVAIVGLGPVGAFAALQLADAGLRVAVLERSREPVELPRAVGIDGESARAFQRLGLGAALDAILQPPREVDRYCFTNSRRETLFGIDLPHRGPNGWRDNSFFDQPELEALLRAQVAQRSEIEVFLGCEAEAVEQSADAVTVHSFDAADGAAKTLRAAWLIACDGAGSFVRRALGIEWQSLGYDQEWLVVDVVQKPEAELPSVMMQVCDPTRLVTYVPVKDPNRRWEFQLLPGESREAMLAPGRIESLLEAWLPPEHYTLRRAAVYQFHAATAARWRVGRIFLAGDAAHQTPPFLGQGLNAGLRDAANLGWKLPLVHAGHCDPTLLDSYAAERDPHARAVVDAAVAIGQLMETLAAREAGRPDPYPPRDPRGGNPGGRTVPPLRGGVLVAEQTGAGPVGLTLEQPLVRRSGGRTCPLDALLGSGFAVVGRTAGDLALSADAARLLERLDGRVVPLEDLEVVEGRVDPLFDAHAAAVVRPDRHVFGVVDGAFDVDRLLAALRRQLAMD